MRCCLRESDTSSASFLGTFPSRGRLLDAFENQPLESLSSAVHLGGLAACSHFAALLLGHYITSGPIAIGPLYSSGSGVGCLRRYRQKITATATVAAM